MSAVDLVAENIIEYLQSAELQVGDKFPTESCMCEKLAISRTTIREAYRKLQSQGYIEIRNGKGAFVKNKNPDIIQQTINWFRLHKSQMQDYLEVRMTLDLLAAKLAALHRSADDIAMLRKIQNDFEKSVFEKDNKSMAGLDAKFHAIIVNISKNELLIALIKIVNYYFEQLRQNSFSLDMSTSV